MHTFDEFDEQTDFSFFTLEEAPPVAVTPNKDRSVKIGETAIGINIGYVYKRQYDGSPFTAEHRANISKAQKGKKHSAEHIAKAVEANTGKKRSIESCKNISKGRTGIKMGDEQKANISKALKGKKHSAEHIAKRVASYAERSRERTANGMVRHNSKSIMTPAGLFTTQRKAAKFFTVSDHTIRQWKTECPEQFYYITKD